ncbi:hypothetical protein A5886_001387 [Enterococcus sp. 8G7_MSG3316]|uniref:ABC transporter domain-containing protein n=1 Tax=Candidatus Enterococcus testudinis TaxID=1834191 RepID=A0A242A5Y9_9ENTE|nr:ABC transporter ATP-binding protein [Enterococcus sp. 8G7_MSG3316]OTN76310.1 hypothetical protein A5886_001387 [Enterococcus sp. 8G7_MSG3316]
MPKIDFKHLTFIRNEQPLLDDISWQVDEGQHWGILGLNGAGKSLLLQMITGALWPSAGTRNVLGEILGKTSVPDLQRRIGWVSAAIQGKFYASDPIEDIVLSGKFASIGLYQHYDRALLEQAKHHLSSLGISHLIGAPFRQLSQGEKQLVMIARALMADPEIMILDEPCTGLDLFAREEFLHRISALQYAEHPPTFIYVTHHTEELLPFFDHLLLLKKGKVYASGPRKQVFTEDNLAAFYEKPITIYPFTEARQIVLPK